ncbi:MAG: hypothetical protein CVV30_06255 [Methanomicrobiales archaeon HGW-Methanomicrobiales-1]|jgi:hypothetical protein|nr:MAG: hypothetical protein CVV30_06255 [Methanomicrobiales archaeon HGW-Methanomicrobiales-1]
MNPVLSQFRTEIRQFYLVSLLNLVFAAIAIAIGVQYMVTAILSQTIDPLIPGFPMIPGLRIFTGAIALICFGLGIRWILSTVRIFEGIVTIKDDLEKAGDAITDERLTCLIVRMLAHYRDNHKTIRTMILVCTLGGGCFFVLGIAHSLKALSVSAGGFAFTLDNLLLIPAMLLTLGIALASLLSSYYFSKFAKVWDRRLHEIDESECTLKKTLGLDEQ